MAPRSICRRVATIILPVGAENFANINRLILCPDTEHMRMVTRGLQAASVADAVCIVNIHMLVRASIYLCAFVID
jgi:hypothetical protein